MSPRAGLEGCIKFYPQRDSISGPPARSKMLYRLRHSDPTNSSNVYFSLLLSLLRRQLSVIALYDLLWLSTNFEQNTVWQNFWTEYQQTQNQYTIAHTRNTSVKKEIKEKDIEHIKTNFDALLTVHLSIFISVFNQPDAQNLFYAASGIIIPTGLEIPEAA
jgi:hypothetical protein